MEEERVTLSAGEQRRVVVLNHLEKGAVALGEAAGLLGISERQVKRLRAEYRQEGPTALVHGNRGRRPANAADLELARRVLDLAQTTYQGFNRQHLTEMLAEREGICLSRATVDRWLRTARVPAVRKRRPAKAHHRRDRMAKEGCLLQVDGSRHDWLEGRGPYLTLVGAIDDATGLVVGATFREQEDAQGYFLVLRQAVQERGVPLALYSDRHGIFVKTKKGEPSLEEQLTGRRQLTQMGRLLEELQVELILARSPQAKGRIERLWGTLQDRLSSELRLQGAATMAAANQVLTRHLTRHNRQFAVLAQDPEPAWRQQPQHLEQLFCFKFHRVVALDHTVRFQGQVIDIPRPLPRSLARARVEVQQRFDGTLRVFHQGRCLATTQSQLLPGPLRLNSLTKPELPLPVPKHSQPRLRRSTPWRPAPNHPWKAAWTQPG
jgi:transposase